MARAISLFDSPLNNHESTLCSRFVSPSLMPIQCVSGYRPCRGTIVRRLGKANTPPGVYNCI